MAYRLRDEKFHLIIENKCNSSCALYLIPAANEVSLTKNAGIVLHGTFSDLKLNKKMKQETIQAGLERGQSKSEAKNEYRELKNCLLYTSPSPRDRQKSRMPSSA